MRSDRIFKTDACNFGGRNQGLETNQLQIQLGVRFQVWK
jgi:hypothetical protein